MQEHLRVFKKKYQVSVLDKFACMQIILNSAGAPQKIFIKDPRHRESTVLSNMTGSSLKYPN